MAGSTKTKGKAKSQKAAPEPEVDEDLELDEVADEEVEETGSKKGGQEEVTFGASDLARHLSETSGKKVTPRELRTLIRKMARDGSGRVNREIKPGNRTRYNWSGLKDPEVKAIIKAFNAGELEADKKAKGEATGKKGKKGKKSKPAPVEAEDDDDELELDDDE